jgi:hypothetical protein
MAADHMDIKYNRASLDDINELVRLRLAYLAADFGELSAKDASNIAESLPAYFERHLDRDLYAHVAWANGKTTNFVFLSGFKSSILSIQLTTLVKYSFI